MSVSDKYPELVRQFFLLDEVKEILPNYPKYKILLQTPEVDREYYKTSPVLNSLDNGSQKSSITTEITGPKSLLFVLLYMIEPLMPV